MSITRSKKMKLVSFYFFFFTFLTQCSNELEDTPQTCQAFLKQEESEAQEIVQKIMRHNLATLQEDEEDWPNEPFYDFLNRTWRYQKDMGARKKRRLVFNLFKSHVDLMQEHPTSVLDDVVTWQDLNLFNGAQEGSPCFIEKIDRTRCEISKPILYFLLSQPTTDIRLIHKRQAIIKEFIDNKELFDELENDFSALKKVENILLSFWTNDPFKQAIERNYIKIPLTTLNAVANRSELLLLCNVIYEHQKRIAWFIASSLATLILPLYGLAQLSGKMPPQVFSDLSKRLIGTNNPSLAFISMASNRFIQAAVGMTGGFYSGLSAGNDFEWMRDNFVAMALVQSKLIEVAECIKVMHRIHARILNHEVLKNNLTLIGHLTLFFNQTSEDLKALCDLLETATFDKEASFFSHQGRILAAYKRLHEIKTHFEKPLCALGEIDAYLSMAKLYKENVHKNARITFVELKEASKPELTIHGLWNHFVGSDESIKNSVHLGGKLLEHIAILTGPNAGGKSTLIKAIALALILAQTFGIAPADTFSLTPLSLIATYLNVADDIAGGNSLFKAQVLRVEKLLRQARLLNSNEFWFIAFDEVFTGTAAKEGQALSYSLAKDLGHFINNICIIATHFPLLTQLEESNAAFANYKVSAHINADGSIHYPFIIERGASSQNVAIDILRAEGFKSSILDEAAALVHNS